MGVTCLCLQGEASKPPRGQGHSLTGGLPDSEPTEVFPFHQPAFRLSITLSYYEVHSWLTAPLKLNVQVAVMLLFSTAPV